MQDQIIVAVFPSRQVLLSALDYLLEEAAADIRRSAVIAKSKTGEILVLDDSMGESEGGIFGGIVGGVLMAIGGAALGAFTLPAAGLLWVLALGASFGGTIGWFIGQVVARRVNFGFAGDIAETLAAQLSDGQPALILQARDAARLLPLLKDNLKQADQVDTFLNLGKS